jgi:hypothetical protein
MLQLFYLDVVNVSDACCKRLFKIFYMFPDICCNHFLSVLSGTKNKGHPQSKIKENKTNGTSRDNKQNASTMFRLVRGSLYGTPRPRFDSYEARSMGRLDH